MADEDEQQLLKVPGAVVGNSAVSLEVLGGFSPVSAPARRKLIVDGVAGESHALALRFHQNNVLYNSWGLESLQSFYINKKIKM